jgi:hypothetical protein
MGVGQIYAGRLGRGLAILFGGWFIVPVAIIIPLLILINNNADGFTAVVLIFVLAIACWWHTLSGRFTMRGN